MHDRPKLSTNVDCNLSIEPKAANRYFAQFLLEAFTGVPPANLRLASCLSAWASAFGVLFRIAG